MQDNSLFLQSITNQDSKVFSNKFCSFSIKINQPEKIYTNSKEISGILTLVPKIPILNIPIQVTILGESNCTLFQQAVTEQSFLVKDSFSAPKSFRLYQTEEDLIQRKNQVEKCLQSSQFLSQTYTQNYKDLIKLSKKEIFLEGKQQIFQLNKQIQNSDSNQVEKRIKVLSQNQKYEYEFSFFVPNKVPISVNSKIFPGVHLYVGYRIEAGFDMDQKFMLCEQKMKAKYVNSGRVYVFTEFQIKRVPEQTDDEIVANKLTFKYFNSEGQIESNESSLTSCLIKCFCPVVWKQRYCYDLYHCELLTNLDALRILHLTARIFLQPDKDKIDVRKVKRGKMYMTNKKSDPEQREQKQRDKQEMTNSKIMPQKQKNPFKINQLKVKFFGQIVEIKKLMIFQKVMQLNRQNYDAVEGELILELMDTYFSQKNQLFEIRYWFQIQPVPQLLNEPKQEIEQTLTNQKRDQPNEFDVTFSKLNGNKEGSAQKLNPQKHQNSSQKGKSSQEKGKSSIQVVQSEQNFIRI